MTTSKTENLFKTGFQLPKSGCKKAGIDISGVDGSLMPPSAPWCRLQLLHFGGTCSNYSSPSVR